MGQIINIPKNTIIKAIMGETEYRTSNKNRSFDEPRQKTRYYSTAGRLTRAQVLVLLELHKHLDSEGYAFDVLIREISSATTLTMQCVNKSIKVLSEKGFIVIGIKEYGSVNYFIDRSSSYRKEENSGGYYQMEISLLNHILKIKSIDELRLVLISLLEDDFARKRKQKTLIPYESVRKIIPSSAHPKARATIIKRGSSAAYRFWYKEEGLVFVLSDDYYGKIVHQRIRLEAENLLSKIKKKDFNLESKDIADIVSLCLEYGTDSIKNAIHCIDTGSTSESLPLGVRIRNYIQTA